MLAALGNPAAKQSKFNVCMDEPVDYGEVAAHLAETRGLPSLECQTVRTPVPDPCGCAASLCGLICAAA